LEPGAHCIDSLGKPVKEKECLMKHVNYLIAVLIFPLMMAACTGEKSDVPGTPGDPALIMFYTDN